jgi:phage baseplate assembly protein W
MGYGMDRHTGKPLAIEPHLRQSIADVVTTPQGSRVMLRDYGSGLRSLVDSPMSPQNVGRVANEVAEALDRWEPRFVIDRVGLVPEESNVGAGQAAITVDGWRKLNDGRLLSLDGLTIRSGGDGR